MARSVAARVIVTPTREKISAAGSAVPGRTKVAREMAEILSLAKAKGLLSGARTLVVRGRMPVELVSQAKRRTGITSDSKLIEAALANIALSDDYAEWLLSQRGTVNAELDLEF
jgi:hypothetical protein